LLSPAEASLRGKIGAYRLHATHDPSATTEKARRTFLDRFLDEVDPQRLLPEQERDRRALMARKAYFAQLALKSARARQRSTKKVAAGSLPNIPATTEEGGCETSPA
jgi:hypothetical protein